MISYFSIHSVMTAGFFVLQNKASCAACILSTFLITDGPHIPQQLISCLFFVFLFK